MYDAGPDTCRRAASPQLDCCQLGIGSVCMPWLQPISRSPRCTQQSLDRLEQASSRQLCEQICVIVQNATEVLLTRGIQVQAPEYPKEWRPRVAFYRANAMNG